MNCMNEYTVYYICIESSTISIEEALFYLLCVSFRDSLLFH